MSRDLTCVYEVFHAKGDDTYGLPTIYPAKAPSKVSV